MHYKLENGGLALYVEPEEQQELKWLSPEEIQQDDTMHHFLEPLTCNGLSWVAPENIGALTDAPILSESCGDCGSHTGGKMIYPADAEFFYFDAYMLRSPLVDLRDKGRVFFNKA